MSCTPLTIPTASNTGWEGPPRQPSPLRSSQPPCWTAIWPELATSPSKPTSLSIQAGRAIYGSRSTGRRDKTLVLTASLTTKPIRVAVRCGHPSTFGPPVRLPLCLDTLRQGRGGTDAVRRRGSEPQSVARKDEWTAGTLFRSRCDGEDGAGRVGFSFARVAGSRTSPFGPSGRWSVVCSCPGLGLSSMAPAWPDWPFSTRCAERQLRPAR